MVTEQTIRLTVHADATLQALAQAVKDAKGAEWHVDWARWLAVGRDIELLEGQPLAATVTLPIYKVVGEVAHHE